MTRATTSADSLLAETEGAGLYYEIAGKGDPVLLIMGLGMASTAWWRTVPVLAKRLRVITFDNRGAGRSHAPRGPYTLAQLAADAVAVLDAARVDRAWLVGHSWGGYLALRVATRFPERVSGVLAIGTLGAIGDGGAGQLGLNILSRLDEATRGARRARGPRGGRHRD